MKLIEDVSYLHLSMGRHFAIFAAGEVERILAESCGTRVEISFFLKNDEMHISWLKQKIGTKDRNRISLEN